jgi:transposase-like protein
MRTDRKPVIDYTRVADGLEFDFHRDRCRYLGKASWEKPQFLKEIAGKWRRIEEVEREAASPAAPVESELNVVAASSGLNGQMSSHDVRDDRGDTPVGNSSAPYQPTSPCAPINENVPSGSIQTERPRSAGPAMTGTDEPKAAANPIGAKGRQQTRDDGRQSKKRQPAAKVTNACSKFSPERARVVLDSLSERPIQSDAARAAGIHRRTLENWIKHSKAGDAGYDIEHEGVIMRFHVHCEWSKEAAYDKILEAAYLIAMGKAYVTDENGNVTLETVRPPNPKMMRFLLEWIRPEVYGKEIPKPDVPQRSGVILVCAPEKPKRTCPAASIKARSWKALSRKFRQTKD